MRFRPTARLVVSRKKRHPTDRDEFAGSMKIGPSCRFALREWSDRDGFDGDDFG
jgi:hypothetical protein